MCERILSLYSTAAVAIFRLAHTCITFIVGKKTSINQVVYLLVEANLKPVAAACETTGLSESSCFLIGPSSHPAAAI